MIYFILWLRQTHPHCVAWVNTPPSLGLLVFSREMGMVISACLTEPVQGVGEAGKKSSRFTQ